MSVSSEVQRTLVKSAPELWAELSDPTTLARHLGELGEIRIVATEPERTVDWEAAGADGAEVNGRVEIKPSGWGTRVTLSASRLVAKPEPEPAPEPEPEAEASAPAPEPEARPEAALAVEPQPVQPAVEIEPPIIDEPELRQGFFARLFRRRHARPTPVEPEPAVEAESTPELVVEPEPIAAVEIEEPALEAAASAAPEEPEPHKPTPETDISSELAELEQQTTAVLTGVLDRLGAAHHRPFSRA